MCDTHIAVTTSKQSEVMLSEIETSLLEAINQTVECQADNKNNS